MNYTQNFEPREFGKRIRFIRKQNNMTQEQLAEKLMVSKDSISNYENGRTNCMHDHIMHMCELFGVSTDYFFFGNKIRLVDDTIDDKIMKLILSYDNIQKKKIYNVLNILYEDGIN